MDYLFYIFVFMFGAIIGSFLNVLIYRMPRAEDFIFRRSHCPHCHKNIAWFENIPLLSFVVLKGRCRACKNRISWRYPFVELLLGMGAVFLLIDMPWTAYGWYFFALRFAVLSILTVHFFIDLEHQILPDSLNLLLGILLLGHALFNFSWTHWALGAAVGAGFPLLVTWVFYLTRGQIGLGGGDIKLYGVLGFFLGPLLIVHTIFLSCFIGALYGGGAILLGKMEKSRPIAFGPFIIIVAALQIFFPAFFAGHLIFV